MNVREHLGDVLMLTFYEPGEEPFVRFYRPPYFEPSIEELENALGRLEYLSYVTPATSFILRDIEES